MAKEQLSFLEPFETLRPPAPLYCHQEFLEKLAEHDRDSLGRRAAFLMQRLSVDSRRLHYKATQGENRGWRRSRLGGNRGSHFYAWWAPKNALLQKEPGEFSSAPEGAVFLRDIRHHDDHSPMMPQSFEANYLPVTVQDIRTAGYAPPPWTQPQLRFASGRQPVRLLKGHPGSGKTTALWNAADASQAERVLYVTYSRDLASLAREYFDRFCSSHKQFQVVVFPHLVREVLGLETTLTLESESWARFRHDLAPFARSLGPWANSQTALYDELHAHLVGDALPESIGRFAACKGPRVPDREYRERRTRFLGTGPVAAALEAAVRLERLAPESLAERYFPELALAWRAVERLRGPGGASGLTLLDIDCVAVDECQDLTPIETLLMVEAVRAAQNSRRHPVPLLLAGDEAQTVRPTDFEWGWLSDLLHSRLGTPTEYKLGANLRSPRRIAGLVNRVWDLYGHLQKQERPSGTGMAEIDDDANDQLLYCTATPGNELNALFAALASREGLALISLEDSVPSYVPEAVRSSVLTVSEAKGLDFHSVCVLDGGIHLDRIVREEEYLRSGSDIEALRKRLAIDQLRVALSRPTERLLWLDINPTDKIVNRSLSFLNDEPFGGEVSSCVPGALLTALQEDDLDVEERIQRCQADARQYLGVKPEIAWSRAQQAVTLLGRLDSASAVRDMAARSSCYLTLAEVCFSLGMRKARLPAELGRPDLFDQAHRAAVQAARTGLAMMMGAAGLVLRAGTEMHLEMLVELARTIPEQKKEIEPWFLLEVAPFQKAWTDELEAAVFNGHNASVLIRILPPFYEALQIPDREARSERLRQRAIQLMIKDGQYGAALTALRQLPERQPKLEAACCEGMRDFRAAAECHQAAGNFKEALNCFRNIPDLDAALQMIKASGDHPAAESLEWIGRLRQLVAERPEKFTKVVTSAEKKMLEEMLERALGVARKKPAPKAAVKKTAAKKPAVPRKRRPAPKDEYF